MTAIDYFKYCEALCASYPSITHRTLRTNPTGYGYYEFVLYVPEADGNASQLGQLLEAMWDEQLTECHRGYLLSKEVVERGLDYLITVQLWLDAPACQTLYQPYQPNEVGQQAEERWMPPAQRGVQAMLDALSQDDNKPPED